MDQTPFFWGYLHSSGSIITKRWGGDHRDYTTDCENNDFVLMVVPPFQAENRAEAEKIIAEKLKEG